MEYIPQIKYVPCAYCRRLSFITLTLELNRENILVVLYIGKIRSREYFDSFDRRFGTERFTKYLNDNCADWTDWIWKARQIESVISKFLDIVYYTVYIGILLDVRKVARMFTKDTGLNDSIVHNFVYTFNVLF